MSKQHTVDRTFTTIHRQMTENTGTHMLDSGGAYGRGWQRKAGSTPEIWSERPAAWCDKYGVIYVDTARWLADRVEYDARSDSYFQRWVERDDKRMGQSQHWLTSMERFAAWLATGDPEAEGWGTDAYLDGTYNTYNWENDLDETLQFIIVTPGPSARQQVLISCCTYVLLQTHNGADVRGGYSQPRVYRILDDAADMVTTEWSLYCDGAAPYGPGTPQQESLDLGFTPSEPPEMHGWYVRDGEWTDADGSFVVRPYEGWMQGNQWDLPVIDLGDGRYTLPCPECGQPAQIESGL